MAGERESEGLPSWKALAELLDGKREIPCKTLSSAKLRLFGDDTEPALTFYRDDAAWCPFSQFVWMALEEKKISYAVKKIHLTFYGEKPEWYFKLVPSGMVPAVEMGSEIAGGIENPELLFYLEEKFPNHKRLLPEEGSAQRDAVPELLNLKSEFFECWKGNLLNGWDSVETLEGLLTRIDNALEQFGGPYFLGKEYSVVDALYTPFLERASSTVPYFHGLEIMGTGRWPAIEAWFSEIRERPVYQAIISDDYTHAHAFMRVCNPVELPSGAAFRSKVDGKDGGWDLPLKAIELPLGSDDGSGANGAKEEAAKTLVNNPHAVARFALRAIPEESEKYKDPLELALRYVAQALLVGTEKAGPLPTDIPLAVAEAIAYLRDRVGVPRDMTFPAARQLRAHLQWMVKHIESSSQ